MENQLKILLQNMLAINTLPNPRLQVTVTGCICLSF